MPRHLVRLLALAGLSAFLVSCSGNPNSALAQECRSGLDTAYSELSIAETKGFKGTVEWTKATSLLAAAKVQAEFEKYPNCIEKVNRARTYISASKGG